MRHLTIVRTQKIKQKWSVSPFYVPIFQSYILLVKLKSSLTSLYLRIKKIRKLQNWVPLKEQEFYFQGFPKRYDFVIVLAFIFRYLHIRSYNAEYSVLIGSSFWNGQILKMPIVKIYNVVEWSQSICQCNIEDLKINVLNNFRHKLL